MKTVIAKIGNMRKPQEFVVYPAKTGENNNIISVQADTVFARIDITSGRAIVANVPNSTHVNSSHLATHGKVYVIPADILTLFIQAQPKQGDTIANGIGIIG